METPAPLLAERAPIAGYGAGVFRIGGLEHPGSLLILPDGVYHWPIATFEDITVASLAAVLTPPSSSFLLLGTGKTQHFLSPAIRNALTSANIAFETMNTGAACRTYNLLLNERRIFAAVLVASI